MVFNFEMIDKFYKNLPSSLNHVKGVLSRPLTLTEKILYTHTAEPINAPFERGKSYVMFSPDRVGMQDATAQMALLQFMCSGRNKTAVPSSVHCDHLILAEEGAAEDLKHSFEESAEVYDFLQSVF